MVNPGERSESIQFFKCLAKYSSSRGDLKTTNPSEIIKILRLFAEDLKTRDSFGFSTRKCRFGFDLP